MPNPYAPTLALARELQLLPLPQARGGAATPAAASASASTPASPLARQQKQQPATSSARLARDATLAAQALHAARGLSLELQAHAGGASVADTLAQQALASALEVGTANNSAIVEQQQQIAARVRALRSKDWLPVEPAHQAALAQLLLAVFQHGGSAASPLARAFGDAAWARGVSAPGSAWEDHLSGGLQLAAACGEYVLVQQGNARLLGGGGREKGRA